MRRPGLARAGHDVHHARRQPGLLDHFGQQQRGERRGLGGLQHHRVAAGQRRRDFPGGHEQREVPGNDLPGDADRLRLAAGERVVELVGPAGVVEEVRGGQRHVDVARLADRLAAVQRLDHRKLARPLLHRARNAINIFAARWPH